MDQIIYIWQRKDWPNFHWDIDKLLPLLYETTQKRSFFLGQISSLDDTIQKNAYADVLENEIISSNSIENILLDRDSVRSSLLSRLGVENAGMKYSDRYTAGAVNIVFDAVTNYSVPLTKERLYGWHSELFPSGMSEGRRIITGNRRQGPIYVVSGSMGKEIIHYEAPPADRIDAEIDRFLKFVNEEESVNILIKAAVAHVWFVSIHPFADGNGRIARTITEMLLAKADGLPHRYYSLSLEIMKNRKEYYDILEYTQKNTMDVTKFIEYFLKTIQKSVATSQAKIEKTIAKTKFWDSIRKYPLNERQIKILNMMQEDFEGKLTTAKWEKLNKCSHSTALRDIKDLIDKGILIDDGKHSKNTSYLLKYTEKNG